MKHNERRQPIAIGHLCDSGDLKPVGKTMHFHSYDQYGSFLVLKETWDSILELLSPHGKGQGSPFDVIWTLFIQKTNALCQIGWNRPNGSGNISPFGKKSWWFPLTNCAKFGWSGDVVKCIFTISLLSLLKIECGHILWTYLSNSKVKVTVLKLWVPTERSCHKNTHVKYQSSASTHC